MSTLQPVIRKTEEYIQQRFTGEGTGHDWYHIDRVRKLALKIAQKTRKVHLEKLELIALLHDLGDHKFHNGQDQSEQMISDYLESLHVSRDIISSITESVKMISFKGAGVRTIPPSIEGQIVQDADRLDAIGAIGIARAFAFGGSRQRPIFIPSDQPHLHDSFEEYKKDQSHTVNHFYEKLLLLKDRMNTKAAKEIAEHRHKFMERFLQQFYDEWNVI